MKKQINEKLKKLKVQYKQLFVEMERLEYEACAAFGYNEKESDSLGVNDWMMDYLLNGMTLEDLHDRVPIKSTLDDKWEIANFDDYHDIEDYKKNKYIGRYELGCFPTNVGYNRYFGIFWNGKLPSRKEILKKLETLVECDVCSMKKEISFPKDANKT